MDQPEDDERLLDSLTRLLEESRQLRQAADRSAGALEWPGARRGAEEEESAQLVLELLQTV